jgi:hypothetical protein
VTSDAAFAATWDDDAPAALLAVRLDQNLTEVGEERGLPWEKGSDRDEGLLNVMGDLCEPGWEALAPLKL